MGAGFAHWNELPIVCSSQALPHVLPSLSLHFPVTLLLFLTLEHPCQYISYIPIATRHTLIQYSQAGYKNIAQILHLHLNLAFKLSQLLSALLQALSIDSIFIKRTQRLNAWLKTKCSYTMSWIFFCISCGHFA